MINKIGMIHGKSVSMNEDAKYMCSLDKENVKFLKMWKTKYDFDAFLNKDCCVILCRKLKNDDGTKIRKQKKLGLPQAKKWLEEANHRLNSENHKKTMFLNKEEDNNMTVL